jgi:hypothetical protein
LSAQAQALPSLRHFVLHATAQAAAMDEWLESMRIGVPSSVFIDAAASMDRQLGGKLEWLKHSVCSVRVRREALFDRGLQEPDWHTPPPPLPRKESFLCHVVFHLPPHIRSLLFQQRDGDEIKDAVKTFSRDTLPPIEEWTLPAGLTELELPCWIDLSQRGQGAAVQLPPQLMELRLGDQLNHSLAKLKLPASLHVLHFGESWDQPAFHWPLLPDSLEELVLPQWFNEPLSSLHLPPSLRKLHFQLYEPFDEGAYGSVSCLFDDPTPNMFPPQLLSLQLPPPVDVRKEMKLQQRAKDENNCAAIVWLGSTPLNLNLLPSSLRFLGIHQSQSLVCDPLSALDSLHLEELVLFRRSSHDDGTRLWESHRCNGEEECRGNLQQQLRRTRGETQPSTNVTDSADNAGSGSTAAAAGASTALSAAAIASSFPSFTMGVNKRG